jgi:molecular chaperone GrpE
MTKDENEKSGPPEKNGSGDTAAKAEKETEVPVLQGGHEEVEYESVEEEGSHPDKGGKKSEPRPHIEEEKVHRARLKKKDTEIRVLRKENEELRDKYLRKLAEMENLRKRLQREREEFHKFALSDFLRELLVVLDNFERALQKRDQADGKSFQEGVDLIYRQYLELLKRRGVRPIEVEDRRFDPNIHHAVLTEESETISEPQVAEVLQRGFWLEDRLLRPAMVKVLVPAKREES